MQSVPIHVLVVEDSESDFDLLALRVARFGFEAGLERVEDEPGMRAALSARNWDLVISDHRLPRFSLDGALRVLREHDPDIPLIVVSGAIGEEAAVDAMLAGADDFIMKDNLARLAPAITRSINSAETRRSRRAAETALRESESMLRSLAANLPAMMFRLDYDCSQRRFSLPYVGEGSRRMFGVQPEALRADPKPLLESVVPEDRESLLERLHAAADAEADLAWEGRAGASEEGGERWMQLRATLREHDGMRALWDGIVFDISDVKRAESEIRELTAHLERVKETERAEAAREIHDDIGAIFFALKIDLAWLRKRVGRDAAILERLASCDAQLDSGVEASQRIVRSLRPAVLDFGVVAAAEWLARDFARRTGIVCKFESNVEDISLAPELGTTVFRVLQESLTNISRHSSATGVTIRLDAQNGIIGLEVSDNGRGIRAVELGKRTSFGVRGMRERAVEFGGTFDIGPASSGGTRLRLNLPLRDGAAPQAAA